MYLGTSLLNLPVCIYDQRLSRRYKEAKILDELLSTISGNSIACRAKAQVILRLASAYCYSILFVWPSPADQRRGVLILGDPQTPKASTGDRAPLHSDVIRGSMRTLTELVPIS